MWWIGFAGTALVMLAYLPQLAHLKRARCAGGVSLRAYGTWMAATLMLLTYAVSKGDAVFIALQSYQLAVISTTSLLVLRRRGTPCGDACGHPRPELESIPLRGPADRSSRGEGIETGHSPFVPRTRQVSDR